MMNEIGGEITIASLRTLHARLETLRHLEMADLLLPSQQKHHEQTLEDAYAALARWRRRWINSARNLNSSINALQRWTGCAFVW